MSMSNEVYKLLKEFSIRMNDRPERPTMDDDEDEFDFDLSGDDDFESDDYMDREFDGSDDDSEFDGMDFDQDELEFGDYERGEPDDEFGNDGFPRGLDDVEPDDGEFGDERKVDITDRLKRLLARRGETEDELNDKIGDTPRSLSLSDVDDFGRRDRVERDHSPEMPRRDRMRR